MNSSSRAALVAIEGLGRKRADRYASDLVGIVTEHSAHIEDDSRPMTESEKEARA